MAAKKSAKKPARKAASKATKKAAKKPARAVARKAPARPAKKAAKKIAKKVATKPAAIAKAGKPAKAEKAEKAEKAAKAEKPAKAEKAAKPEKAEKPAEAVRAAEPLEERGGPRPTPEAHVGEELTAAVLAAAAAATPVPHEAAPMPTTADGGTHVAMPAHAPRPPASELALKAGDEAPAFTLPADDGSQVSLADLRGRKVVLYFYPRDNTPGCTIEAEEFSSLLPEFDAKNAVVLGVSTDTCDSHRHFKNAKGLAVRLLSDEDTSVHKSYGTWREKNMYGRKVWGTARTTFLIAEDGRIERIWERVKVDDHAADVLGAIA